MGKKATRPDGAVKLQIPVPAHMAAEVADLAARMKKPVAWMSEELLKVAMADRKTLVGRIHKWLMAAANSTLGRRRKPTSGQEEETVRLQVYVSPELAQEIEDFAEAMNMPTIRMATWLIDAAIDEESLPILIASTKTMQRLVKGFAKSEHRKHRAREITKLDGKGA